MNQKGQRAQCSPPGSPAVSPPCQHRSLGIPSLPMFLCQEKAAHHLIRGGKECTGLRQPDASKTACAPRGAGRGARGSSGDFGKEHSPGASAALDEHGHSGMGVQEPHPEAHQHPRKLVALGNATPISKAGRPFFPKTGDIRPRSSLVLPKGRGSKTAFSHS